MGPRPINKEGASLRTKAKHALRHMLYDVMGNLLLGLSVTAFAVKADFAPGGVSGLAVMANYLFGLPIGMMTLAFNVPVILCTFKRLGLRFFIYSAITLCIGAIMVDYVLTGIPDPGISRWAASVLAGLCAGAGYALIFRIDSSTGGTDFIIVALKRWRPQLTFGFLAFVIDGLIICLSVFVYHDWISFGCGMVYTLVTSLTMDAVTKCMDLWVKHHPNDNKQTEVC